MSCKNRLFLTNREDQVMLDSYGVPLKFKQTETRETYVPVVFAVVVILNPKPDVNEANDKHVT